MDGNLSERVIGVRRLEPKASPGSEEIGHLQLEIREKGRPGFPTLPSTDQLGVLTLLQDVDLDTRSSGSTSQSSGMPRILVGLELQGAIATASPSREDLCNQVRYALEALGLPIRDIASPQDDQIRLHGRSDFEREPDVQRSCQSFPKSPFPNEAARVSISSPTTVWCS